MACFRRHCGSSPAGPAGLPALYRRPNPRFVGAFRTGDDRLAACFEMVVICARSSNRCAHLGQHRVALDPLRYGLPAQSRADINATLYIAEAALLAYVFWEGLSLHPLGAWGGVAAGAIFFVLVLPSFWFLGALFGDWRRPRWARGTTIPDWTASSRRWAGRATKLSPQCRRRRRRSIGDPDQIVGVGVHALESSNDPIRLRFGAGLSQAAGSGAPCRCGS